MIVQNKTFLKINVGKSLNIVLIIKMVISKGWGLLLNNRIALPALLV